MIWPVNGRQSGCTDLRCRWTKGAEGRRLPQGFLEFKLRVERISLVTGHRYCTLCVDGEGGGDVRADGVVCVDMTVVWRHPGQSALLYLTIFSAMFTTSIRAYTVPSKYGFGWCLIIYVEQRQWCPLLSGVWCMFIICVCVCMNIFLYFVLLKLTLMDAGLMRWSQQFSNGITSARDAQTVAPMPTNYLT